MSKFFAFALLAFTLLFSAPSYSRPPVMMLGGDVGLAFTTGDFGDAAKTGLAFPTGDFGDAAKTGFGLNGAFTYFLQPDLALTGILGYWSFGSKISGGGYDIDISWSTIPLNAGIQYRFQASGWHPYIGAETFLFFSSASVKYLGHSWSSSDTDFGFTPLVGGAFKISPNLEFRATAKYVIIFTSGSNTTFFSLLGGIHFILP